MTYATLDDLNERAGATEINQVADRDNSGEADGSVITAALEDADNIINGYVTQKYPPPFASTPSLLRTWAVSIARYVLHRDGAPDYVETDYKDAIASLKDVARGLMSIPDATGVTPTQINGTTQSYHPEEVFTEENLRGWK